MQNSVTGIRQSVREELLQTRLVLIIGGIFMLLTARFIDVYYEYIDPFPSLYISIHGIWIIVGVSSYYNNWVRDHLRTIARLCYGVFYVAIAYITVVNDLNVNFALILIAGYILIGITFNRVVPFVIYALINLIFFPIIADQNPDSGIEPIIFLVVGILSTVFAGTFGILRAKVYRKVRDNLTVMKELLDAYQYSIVVVDSRFRQIIYINKKVQEFKKQLKIDALTIDNISEILELDIDALKKELGEQKLVKKEIQKEISGTIYYFDISCQQTPISEEQVIIISIEDVTEKIIDREKIKADQRKFRDLFNNSPEAIFVESMDGKILDVNQAACRLHHMEREDLLSKSVEDLIPEFYKEKAKEDFESLKSGETDFLSSVSLTSTGEVKYVEIRCSRITFNDAPALLLHVTNVTKRKETEKRLLLFRNLINQSHDMIFVIDPDSLMILDFNERVTHELGYSERSEVEGLSLLDVEASFSSNELLEETRKRIFSEQMVTFIGAHKRKNGSQYPVEVNAKLIELDDKVYILAVARNISDRRANERALRDSEQRYRMLVENMNEGIIRTDGDERIIYLNERMADMIGLPKESLIGKKTFEVLKGENNLELLKEKSELRRQGISDQYEMPLLHISGKVQWMLATGAPYKDTTDKIVGTIAIFTDITDRKHAELKLKEKNEELDSFVYKASHDLKGPLASIIGLVNVAKGEVSDENTIRYLDLINQSTERLDTILMDLIDVTRMNKASVEYISIDTSELIDGVISSLKHNRKSERVQFSFDVNLKDTFYSDPKLIISILQNLISNSINYQNPEKEHPFVHVEATQFNEFIKFKVSDNGLGIPKSLQKKVFNMFFRGNKNSKGTGLGLYIVKNSIEKLGGNYELKSDEAKGTTFSFVLPMNIKKTEENRYYNPV